MSCSSPTDAEQQFQTPPSEQSVSPVEPDGPRFVNPIDMVAAAAEEQAQYGAASMHEMLVTGSLIECVIGGQNHRGVVVTVEDDWLYLETVVRTQRQLVMLNLKLLQSARTLEPASEFDEDAFPLTEAEINMNLATERLKEKRAENKRKTIEYDVSLEGIETFLLMKRLFTTVSWNGTSVVVGKVSIKDPYTVESATAINDDPVALQALERIKRVLPQVPDLVQQRRDRMSEQGLLNGTDQATFHDAL